MTEEELQKIEKTINAEDHPGDVWFIETIQKLVDALRKFTPPW